MVTMRLDVEGLLRELDAAPAGEVAVANGTPGDRRGAEQTPEIAVIGAPDGIRGGASETADGDPASDN